MCVDAVGGAFLRFCGKHGECYAVGTYIVVGVERGVAVNCVCIGGGCVGDGGRESANIDGVSDFVMRDCDSLG